MTFEDIQRVSGFIKTTPVKGKQYAEVNQRIKAFRMLCPNGTIATEIYSLNDGVVVMKASVLDEDGRLLGTGTAYEKEGSSNINKTSFIENCETSAVGRALAMCGFGIDVSVASFEEVDHAIEQQDAEPEKKEPVKKQKVESAFPSRQILIDIAKNHYPDGSSNLQALLKTFGAKCIDEMTDDQLKAIYTKFGGR